ncbi:hypothetical protein OH76DRAFT_1400619 [Lentinus brumalis]|uniref:Uncharacterized protein n=1 Tax=Lentinus brumalis TaxID=2498619 RepID=A0A371DIC1_9APHY|nr:hypothetical protein OH76DRAFT_1400619 [Polyporus brumalis]
MASPRPRPRTWYYGFRMEPEDVIKLAIHVKAKEPEGSNKLISLPEDLSPPDRQKPFDPTSPDWERIEEIKGWAYGYVQKEADVSVSPTMRAEVQHHEDTAQNLIEIMFFARKRVLEDSELDLAACRLSEYVKEDIERVRAVLPHDQGGWYRNFDEYAREHPWSPPGDSPSTGDNPAA